MTTPVHSTVLRISHESEDELDRKLIAIMTHRGYVVTKAAPDRITIAELAKRVGRRVSVVSRSLTRPSCPPFEALKGKRRTLWIVPNDKLISYLTTNPSGRPASKI